MQCNNSPSLLFGKKILTSQNNNPLILKLCNVENLKHFKVSEGQKGTFYGYFC
jgi:hypothetical protein